MKISKPIKVKVEFDDMKSLINDLGNLQTYKLFEGDEMTLVDTADVADVLAKHVKAMEAERIIPHWIPCSERLPEKGVNVILTFKDTFHIHPWPISVMPAWICNVGEERSPNGEWAIEGRLGNFIIKLEDGIAWMPLPEPYREVEHETQNA